jgi:hypothetical protein
MKFLFALGAFVPHGDVLKSACGLKTAKDICASIAAHQPIAARCQWLRDRLSDFSEMYSPTHA